MNKSKKVELMAAIGSLEAERIALNERLARYQAELAAARERISSMEERISSMKERISSMEERFELIAVLAGSPNRRDIHADPPKSEQRVAETVEIGEVSAIRHHR
jgi:predicted nuclease with TOPRIM domain